MNVRLIATCMATAILAACSGGANSSLPRTPSITVPAPTKGTIPKTQGGATFTIKIPAASMTVSGTRAPKYISTATQSVQIALTTVNSIAYSAIPAQSANCTTTTCTITFSAIPTGTDVFTVTTYKNTIAQGQTTASILSTGTVSATVTAHANTAVNLVLAGCGKTAVFPQALPFRDFSAIFHDYRFGWVSELFVNYLS